MCTSLTSRERVWRALTRQDHDRIPRADSFWPETISRWQAEGLDGDGVAAHELLGNDIGNVNWVWPVPYPGREEIIEEDQETKLVIDRMGNTMRLWKNKSGTPEHVAFGCDTSEKWFDQYKPALLKTTPTADAEQLQKCMQTRDGQEMFNPLRGIEAFEAMRQLVGDEILLMAMAGEPEWVLDMSKTYTDLVIRDQQAVLDLGVKADALWVYGDVGYNHGPFFSPSMYRELIWPDHCRLCDWAHQRDQLFIYHTDGDVRTLIPDFVAGAWDAMHPLEAKANMDLRDLVPQYGDHLSFFGNVDMTVACTNDLEKVEQEVVTKIRAGKQKRGYVYHSDHSVPPGVSWKTYQFMIEVIEKHGVY